MDIVILSDFCGDFGNKVNGRFQYIADLLSGENAVEILTSDFLHGEKRHFSVPQNIFSYKVTMLHEPAYEKNVSVQRILSHRAWGKEVARYLEKRTKPDVIYCAMPPLTAAVEAAKYCRKNGVRFIVDIQDLWPEAFEMVFHVPILSRLLFSLFRALANKAYRAADAICAVSQTYADRAKAVNSGAPAYSVFLGTDLGTFDANAAANRPDLTGAGALPKKEGPWLAYCGSLGASYDLELVINALALLGKTAPLFVVMGAGERQETLRRYAADRGVKAYFTGWMPYQEMCGLLCACDMTVNPIRAGAAQSIINKHADYAASGLPVLNTQEGQEYRTLIEEYEMGFDCSNKDPGDLAEKIALLIRDPALRQKMGQNARRCAEEKFDRKNTYREIISCVTEC